MNISPQSSLISIITFENEDKKTLLFAYLKQLDDINPPSKLYWRDKSGVTIWEDKSVKQWIVYGNDENIENYWNEIIKNQKVILNKKEYNFFAAVGTELRKKKKGKSIYFKLGKENIPQYLLEDANLRLIEGYKTNESGIIKPLEPPGLFPDGFLHKNLNVGFRCCKELRHIHYHFRGTRINKDDKEPTQMIGFIQSDIKNHDYIAEFVSEDGILLGRSVVNKTKGTFKVPLNKPSSRARFILKDASNIVVNYKYTLLKGTTVNTQIVDKTFKDLFGRETAINQHENKNFDIPQAYSWHKELSVSERESQIDISDYMKKLFCYLGPNILICDPYFIGKIPPITDYEKKSYKLFFNALLSSAAEQKIYSVTFLGNWSRSSSILKKTKKGYCKEQYFEDAKNDLKTIVEQNNFEKYLPIKGIRLINSFSDFHSRLWIGLKNQNGKVIVNTEKIFFVSSSFNGFYKSGELDFMPCTEPLQAHRIAAKYDNIIKNNSESFSID